VYFNVTDEGMKYGVVQLDDLLEDVTKWKYLFLAGRMHKPVVTVIDRQEVGAPLSVQWQQETSNLPAALSAALLLHWLERRDDREISNTTTVNPLDVYTKIASLSYSGDPRMLLGAEDPRKINKLVQSTGQPQRFQSLYRPALQRLEHESILSVESQENTWTWDSGSPLARAHLCSSLPVNLQGLQNDPSALPAALAAIVGASARYQSFKGLWTAGVRKSVWYATRKLTKGLLARR
jgi:translocator assembly and maintenance protein 41